MRHQILVLIQLLIMCLNPIHIKNPKLKTGTYDKNRDFLFLDVPCGKCWQCQQTKINEWIFRNYSEYIHTKYNHGITFYYTLTYNDDSINRHGSVFFFSPEKIGKFTRNLHNKLKRYDYTIKYYIVSELGDKTFRPHHHALFYLTPISSRRISPQVFDKVLSDTWKYGFIKCGDNHGIVNSSHALSYCCKYLLKDSSRKRYTSTIQIESYQSLAKYITRHLGTCYRVSSGLGKSLLKSLTIKDFDKGYKDYPIDGHFKRLYIPEYYKRKVLKDSYVNDNGNISYKLNELGISLLKNQFEKFKSSLNDTIALVNSAFNTHYSYEHIFDCLVRHGMPKSLMHLDDYSLYRIKKLTSIHRPTIKQYDINQKDIDNTYLITRDSHELFRRFINHKNTLSYEKYRNNQISYNLRQRLLYSKSKKEVIIKTFRDYVNFSVKRSPAIAYYHTSTLAGNYQNYKILRL